MNEHALVSQLLNTNEGDVCSLCQMTDGKECIMKEQGVNRSIWVAGMDAEEEAEDQGKSEPDAARMARFACYRAYVFQVSNWHSGLGRIRVPKCVVDNIRRKFPGDGKYVGHKDVPISGSG